MISSFGFQTEFMMRYMLLAFGAVSVFLLLVAAGVNPGAMEGAAIFARYFSPCAWFFGGSAGCAGVLSFTQRTGFI